MLFKTGSCDPQSLGSWAFTDIIIHYRIPHHKKGLKLSGGISSNTEALRICWSSRQKWRRSKAMQDEEGVVRYVMQKYLKGGFFLQAICRTKSWARILWGKNECTMGYYIWMPGDVSSLKPYIQAALILWISISYFPLSMITITELLGLLIRSVMILVVQCCF